MSQFLQSLADNAAFLLACLAVFAGLILIAWAAERFFLPSHRKLSPARTVSFVAIFAALGGALMFFEIPLFFAPSFYEMDLSELPVLICTFYLGPVAGVVCEFLKVVIKLLLKGTSTAFVGDFANFAVGCAMVLPASILYHLHKSKKMALMGLAVGTLVMTVFGSAFNAYFLIPKFAELFHMPLDAIVAMGTEVNGAIHSVGTLVLFAVVPFNLLKGVVISALTLVLYKRVERLFFHQRQVQVQS